MAAQISQNDNSLGSEEIVNNNESTIEDKREKIFMRRLNAFFDNHGMSPLTKKMAYAYIQQMASEGEKENFARVQPWLLNQINNSKVFPSGCSEWQVSF